MKLSTIHSSRIGFWMIVSDTVPTQLRAAVKTSDRVLSKLGIVILGIGMVSVLVASQLEQL